MPANDDPTTTRKATYTAWTTVAPLVIGILLLAFLYVIDRTAWFQIRPASGTAAAMGHAAMPPETAVTATR